MLNFEVVFKSSTDGNYTDREACQSEEYPGHKVTCYSTLLLLGFLLIFESLQLSSKIKEGEWYEYFGAQNVVEFAMFTLTISLFSYQWHDDGMKFKFKDVESWDDKNRQGPCRHGFDGYG